MVTATQGQGGVFALTVEANGQRTTVTDVQPDELAERIARLIRVVAEAARNGDLDKHRQWDSQYLGLGAPRSSRENMRFTA
jgi:hypothetical protein